MKRTKQEKAITLIALIITIIILLILAVVTIAAITGDGDLISYANNAKVKYMDEAANENTTVQWYLEKMSGGNDEPDDDTDNGETPEELKQYILGTDLQGRYFIGNNGLWDMENEKFADSTGMLNNGLKELPEYVFSENFQYNDIQETDGNEIWYIKYDGSYYKLLCKCIEEGENIISDPEFGVKKIKNVKISTSTQNPGIGSKINYDNQNWIVMYKNGNEIQMISEKVNYYDNNKFYLGCEDSYLIKYEEMVDGTDVDKAMYSYNNAIDTLNKACTELVDTSKEYITSVRCVGSNPNNKNSENNQMFTSEYLNSIPEGNPGACNGKGKSSDTNYVEDFERLMQLGINVASYTGTLRTWGQGEEAEIRGDTYWLASRICGKTTNNSLVGFDVGHMEVWGKPGNQVYYGGFFSITNNYINYSSECHGLRPVVTVDTTKCTFNYDSANSYFTIN